MEKGSHLMALYEVIYMHLHGGKPESYNYGARFCDAIILPYLPAETCSLLEFGAANVLPLAGVDFTGSGPSPGLESRALLAPKEEILPLRAAAPRSRLSPRNAWSCQQDFCDKVLSD